MTAAQAATAAAHQTVPRRFLVCGPGDDGLFKAEDWRPFGDDHLVDLASAAPGAGNPEFSDLPFLFAQEYTPGAPSIQVKVATVFLEWLRDSFWTIYGPLGGATNVPTATIRTAAAGV